MTLTIKEAYEWAEPIEQDFEEIGIPLYRLKKPPGASSLAYIGMGPGRKHISLWPGTIETADISIEDFDYDLCQVVLSMTENGGDIEKDFKNHSFRVYGGEINNKTLAAGLYPIQIFGFNFPEGTTFTRKVTSFTEHERDPEYPGHARTGHCAGNIVAHIPKSKRTFLVGYDETSLFISELPTNIKTMARAHSVLRPSGLSDKAIRVGEWFLDPADEATVANLWKSRVIHSDSALGNTMNHRASVSVYSHSNQYVMGRIYDTTGRHEDVILDGWHRVVRNREVESDDSYGWD